MLGKLVERTEHMAQDVHEIKAALETHAVKIEARVASLELKAAEATGGTKMMMIFGGAAATVGGLVASVAGKVWPG